MKKDVKKLNALSKPYIESLYEGTTGFIGYKLGEKEQNQEKQIFLTYGEILYDSVSMLLSKLDITENDVFCDLGSGIGKLIAQVFITTKVQEAFGVEASKIRYEKSSRAAYQIKRDFPSLTKSNRKLYFINSNFLEADISQATIIYSCSTCFSETLLTSIGQMIKNCKNLKYLLTLKPIPCELPLIETIDIDCSWDKSKCFVYGNHPIQIGDVNAP